MSPIKSLVTETVDLKSNPYLKLFYGSLRARGAEIYDITDTPETVVADVVHLHWPERFLRKLNKRQNKKALLRFLFTLANYKRRKIPIVWTVHNALPHEKHASRLSTAVFYRVLTYLVDGCLYMSETGRSQCESIHSALAAKPSAVVPHGHYRDVVNCSQSAEESRRQLGVGAGQCLIGHYGLIRGYKNTLQLIRVFNELSPQNTVLVIAGRSWSKTLEGEIERAVQGNDRIRYINRALDEDEMSNFVFASDLIALPYRRVSNSGAALYALSLNVPVLGPAQGAFLELQERHPDWVLTYEGEFSAQALGDALAWVGSGAGQGEVDLSAYDWDRLAGQTLEFYQRVKGSRSKG
ncbi:glycosyltransferase family 4 protein [Pseudomaricurvus sp. HS19]|uniref:glycosyltransferase family 4 protein n=1 Tax=Pseudomaricurvus sp. HS19 TaxID=2692626 RepID=UPI00136BD839|nr:glycosyltransferase family 4 protein [Pseudomaricurvus sp. HS19]MYM62936.1 glycosyltransferase [Pseudomaricurvus sp. HS19]